MKIKKIWWAAFGVVLLALFLFVQYVRLGFSESEHFSRSSYKYALLIDSEFIKNIETYNHAAIYSYSCGDGNKRAYNSLSVYSEKYPADVITSIRKNLKAAGLHEELPSDDDLKKRAESRYGFSQEFGLKRQYEFSLAHNSDWRVIFDEFKPFSSYDSY